MNPLEWKPSDADRGGEVAHTETAHAYAFPDGSWCCFAESSASDAEGYEPDINAAKRRAEAVIAALLT